MIAHNFMCLFFLSLSNIFSCVKWQEVDLDQHFGLSICGVQNEESKYSHEPKCHRLVSGLIFFLLAMCYEPRYSLLESGNG